MTGTSIPELRASIRARAREQPDGTSFAGYTTWSLAWRYARATTGATGCAPRGVEVDLELAVRYPVWTDSANAFPSVRREWQRYLAALKAHEANHAAIAIKGANQLVRELRKIVAPSCTIVRVEGQTRATEIMNSIREQNRLYDETTRSGATEGASLVNGP